MAIVPVVKNDDSGLFYTSVSLRDFSMKLSRLDPKGQMINEAPKRAL